MDIPLYQQPRNGEPLDRIYHCTDKIGTSGLEEIHPLHLFNPFRLSAGMPLWITCPYPVTMLSIRRNFHKYLGMPYHTRICCKSPIKVQLSTTTWLVPQNVLEPTFAKGWTDLAAEIKVKILRHNLCIASPINARSYEIAVLKHHLLMTPEIAALSKEAFYSDNVIEFEVLPALRGFVVRLPPSNAMLQVRRARIDIRFRTWRLLEVCSRALLNMPDFQHLKIVIELIWEELRILSSDGPSEEESRIYKLERLIGRDNVSFKCKGEVVFDTYPADSRAFICALTGETLWGPTEDELVAVESLIRPKISFQT